MRTGLIARADNRGLGVLLWEAYRHLEPDRTLVVREPGAEAKGFTPHLDRYPGGTVVTVDPATGRLPEEVVRPWLRGLDVVYTAETPYDFRLYEWCRELRVRTVCHAMPEFWRHELERGLPRPDVAWLPTTWRAGLIPDARLVPVPVALDRLATRVRREPVFLHPVGHRTAADRAGTTSVARALRLVHAPCRVVVATQDPEASRFRGLARGVDVEVRTGGVEHWWDSYDEASVLLHPRRFGGLSLPANEAAGAGLALVLPDVEPNRETWPGLYVPARPHGTLRAPGGEVTVYDTNAPALARAIDRLASSPDAVADLSAASLAWAQEHSWEALLPVYLDELDRACS
jgi:hypothetical protein